VRPVLELSSTESSALGISTDVRMTVYGQSAQSRFSGLERATFDASIEAYYDLIGAAARMRFFCRYAFQPDDFISPIPQSTSLIAFGIRIFDPLK
jgi:hypothetical protein